ncbi:LysE/ArgO family amino acid transporter [Nocardioides sp. CPCC 206347]|uniref:LysE/ArgO family amino acid transporter n=1 Tax=Nocardioides sp. CPCC 206347 TaxID=3406463 RepID=UPI003B437114
MLAPTVAGLVTGLTLIVAIGAQNALVLRQGLIRSHVGPVVAICALSDAVLIAAGVGGIGTIVDHARWVLEVVRWLGVAFLLWYAAASLRRATRPESLAAAGNGTVEPSGPVIGRAIALTWLNPHVYLDTVLLVGSIAAAHDGGEPAGHWWFGAGAVLASVLWFSSLGYGARLLAPLLARPRAWQVLEVLIAITMLFVAARLALG